MAQSEAKAAAQISPALRDLFRSSLTALDEEQLRKINEWSKSNSHLLIGGQFHLGSVAEELDIPSSELYRVFRLIGNVLLQGKPLGSIDVGGYSAALSDLSGDLSAKARIVLNGIRVDPDEAEYARQKGIVSSAILPTLVSVGALCDLRAVFQDLPSPSNSKSHRERISRLLGFEPMVVVSLELNDSSDNETSCAFQVTEQSMRSILKTLEEALVQLEVVREYQKTTTRSSENAK